MGRGVSGLAPSAIIPPLMGNPAPCRPGHPLASRTHLPKAQTLVLVLLPFQGLSTFRSRVRKYVQKVLWLPGKRHAHHRKRFHQRR